MMAIIENKNRWIQRKSVNIAGRLLLVELPNVICERQRLWETDDNDQPEPGPALPQLIQTLMLMRPAFEEGLRHSTLMRTQECTLALTPISKKQPGFTCLHFQFTSVWFRWTHHALTAPTAGISACDPTNPKNCRRQKCMLKLKLYFCIMCNGSFCYH